MVQKVISSGIVSYLIFLLRNWFQYGTVLRLLVTEGIGKSRATEYGVKLNALG
jgi:hypothetical protein